MYGGYDGGCLKLDSGWKKAVWSLSRGLMDE